MSQTILACDLGTSGCKLAAFDPHGRVLATASAAYAATVVGAGAEQTARDWMLAFHRTVVTLVAGGQVGDAACIAFTGQMSAALAVDAQAEALRPCLIWSDQRAAAEAEFIADTVSRDAFYRITGNPISPTYTIAKALWIKRHEPDIYRRTAKFLQPKDWLVAQLTGIMAIDASDASCTGLLDLARGQWDTALARAVGLDTDKLPDIASASQVIGRVTRAGAEISGLPEGLRVVLGGGDGPTSALGAGIVRPGQSYVSLGTSAWISFVSDAPVADPGQRVFSLRHVLPGLFAHTGATQNAANVLSWLSNDVLGGGSLESSLASTTAGADGLLCLPYLNGERTPYWDADAAGVYFGLRPQHRREHMVRAMAEGVCHHLRLITDVFADLDMQAKEMIALGGLAENPAFVRLLASALGKPHRVALSASHATCRGAAMLGAVGAGLCGSVEDIRGWAAHAHPVAPDPASEARLKMDHPAFLELYRCLMPMFRRRRLPDPPLH